MDATYDFPPSPTHLLGSYHPEIYGTWVNWVEAERREETPEEDQEDDGSSFQLPMIQSFEEAQRPADQKMHRDVTPDEELHEITLVEPECSGRSGRSLSGKRTLIHAAQGSSVRFAKSKTHFPFLEFETESFPHSKCYLEMMTARGILREQK